MGVIQIYKEPLKSRLYKTKESNFEKHMRNAHDEMACGKVLLANPSSGIEITMAYIAQLLELLKSEVLARSHLGLGGGAAGVFNSWWKRGEIHFGMHSEVSYRTKWALISWSSNHTMVCKEDGKLLWKLLSSAIKGCFLEGVFKDPEVNVAKRKN